MLHELGLSPMDQRLYEMLVARPPLTQSELDTLLAGDEWGGQGQSTLDRLRDLDLVTRVAGEPPRHTATPPNAALNALLSRRDHELAQARQRLFDLSDRFYYRHPVDDRRCGGDPLVVVIRGEAAMADAIAVLNRGARHEVAAFDAPPYFDGPTDGPTGGNVWPGDPPRWELACRVIYDRRILGQPKRIRHLVEYENGGAQQVRIADVPMKLMLVDGRVGLMPLDQVTDPIEAFVLVRDPGLVAALSALFELCWEHAVPVHLQDRKPGVDGPVELSTMDQELLSLLVAGYSDLAIATHFGSTDRTVRRRTRHIMRQLGADTRFQAGYLAVSRGWLGLHPSDAPTTPP